MCENHCCAQRCGEVVRNSESEFGIWTVENGILKIQNKHNFIKMEAFRRGRDRARAHILSEEDKKKAFFDQNQINVLNTTRAFAVFRSYNRDNAKQWKSLASSLAFKLPKESLEIVWREAMKLGFKMFNHVQFEAATKSMQSDIVMHKYDPEMRGFQSYELPVAHVLGKTPLTKEDWALRRQKMAEERNSYRSESHVGAAAHDPSVDYSFLNKQNSAEEAEDPLDVWIRNYDVNHDLDNPQIVDNTNPFVASFNAPPPVQQRRDIYPANYPVNVDDGFALVGKQRRRESIFHRNKKPREDIFETLMSGNPLHPSNPNLELDEEEVDKWPGWDDSFSKYEPEEEYETLRRKVRK